MGANIYLELDSLRQKNIEVASLSSQIEYSEQHEVRYYGEHWFMHMRYDEITDNAAITTSRSPNEAFL